VSSTAPYAPLSPLTPLPDLRLSASLGQYGEQKTARAICIYIPRPPPAPSRPPHAPFTLVQSELRHFSDEIESMRSTIAETAGMQMRIALKEQEAAEAEARASEANAQAAALKMRLARMQMEGGWPQSEDPPPNSPPTEGGAIGSPGIPLDCLRWFDGCNMCRVTPEGV